MTFSAGSASIADQSHRIDVQQQRRGAAFICRFGVKNVGAPEREVDGLQASRILMKQMPEIGRRRLSVGYRQKHGQWVMGSAHEAWESAWRPFERCSPAGAGRTAPVAPVVPAVSVARRPAEIRFDRSGIRVLSSAEGSFLFLPRPRPIPLWRAAYPVAASMPFCNAFSPEDTFGRSSPTRRRSARPAFS